MVSLSLLEVMKFLELWESAYTSPLFVVVVLRWPHDGAAVAPDTHDEVVICWLGSCCCSEVFRSLSKPLPIFCIGGELAGKLKTLPGQLRLEQAAFVVGMLIELELGSVNGLLNTVCPLAVVGVSDVADVAALGEEPEAEVFVLPDCGLMLPSIVVGWPTVSFSIDKTVPVFTWDCAVDGLIRCSGSWTWARCCCCCCCCCSFSFGSFGSLFALLLFPDFSSCPVCLFLGSCSP